MQPALSLFGAHVGDVHVRRCRRAPSQLEEAAKSLAGAKPGDDGRVEVGRTERGVAGQGGRFWLFFTGFARTVPFCLSICLVVLPP